MPEMNSEMKYVKAAELFRLTREIIEQDGHVWITVTGMSMYPFLKDGRDSVELSKATFGNIRKGDIVLIRRANGAFVLHRVLKKEKNCFYIIGDAQQWVEGPLIPEQLQSVVTRIKRRKRVIRCDNPLLKVCVLVWIIFIPIRYKIFRVARLVKKLLIKIFPGLLSNS